MSGEHTALDTETENARDEAADVPFRSHGVGEEDVRGEQRLPQDDGLRRGRSRSAVQVPEKTLQKGKTGCQ